MFKNLLEHIRNKRIQRLLKKTYLWTSTEIDFLTVAVKQNFNDTYKFHKWLEEIEADGKNKK